MAASGRHHRFVAALKQKGDLAELAVAHDLVRRGFRVAFPYGEDCNYDLIVDRGDRLDRVQVKHTRSNGEVVIVRCRSHSLTNGKVRVVKHYTAEIIEWIAVYDVTTDRCYYIPASELGTGRSVLHLRVTPARSGRRQGIRAACDYLQF
jgi:hypothetical protein